MRVVAVADTHTYEAQLGELPAGDVFVHAGDLGRRGSLEELAPVAAWIRALPHRHKVVVAGNHDRCFQEQPAEARALFGDSVIYLEDAGITLDGLSLWGSPWQPEFHNWAFNLPRGAPLAEKWALIPTGVDLLITHSPPQGIGDACGEEHFGCADLLAELERARPRLHLYGHIHQDGGMWSYGESMLANVTTWEGCRGATVIDLEPGNGPVRPVAVPPRERLWR